MPATSAILWLIAVVLAVWGASLVARYLWADRDRRRRCCPVCLTELGAPQALAAPGKTCGVCGFESKRERRFHPPRRRWWVMAIGVDAILAAIAVAYLGEVVGVWPQIEREFQQIRGITEHSPAWAAWAIGLVGAGVLIWGWRGSRPRGRRRCPRCWYDMSGIGLTCPECGAAGSTAVRLYKPRRRNLVIALGVLLLASAWVGRAVTQVRRGGWQAAIPTTVLIVGMEWLPDTAIYQRSHSAGREDRSLVGRMRVGRLFTWQRAWAKARARSLVLAEGDPRVVSVAAAVVQDWPGDTAVSNACFRCLAREVGNEDHGRREFGAQSLWIAEVSIGDVSLSPDEMARFTPGLIRALDDDSDEVYRAACLLLRWVRPTADAAAPHLFELVRVGGRKRAQWARFALYAMAPESPAVRDGALAALGSQDHEKRQCAIMCLGRTPPGDSEVTARLLEVLRGPNHEDSHRAAHALRRQAPPSLAIPALFEQFRGDRPRREEYLHWLAPSLRDDSDDRELEKWIPELAALLDSSISTERGAACYLISNINPSRSDLSPALPAIERLQNDPDPDIAGQSRFLAPRIRARQARLAELAEDR